MVLLEITGAISGRQRSSANQGIQRRAYGSKTKD